MRVGHDLASRTFEINLDDSEDTEATKDGTANPSAALQ